jgi:predicted CXXCH cytochrome family protein
MLAIRMHSLPVLLILLTASGAWAAKDSCFECHSVQEGMSIVFKDDIHYKYGISCADCHGGDRQEDNGNLSMSAGRGFKVRVTREDAPEYCGRCHSDAAFIGKHKPGQRADQVALYRKSVHGVELAKGNKKTANCIDCHGIHNIRAVADPESPVHPSHLAGKCGDCHGEIAKMFQQSPHAKVFTTRGMAGCSVCHSSHGTERTGVATLTGAKPVCARCHSASSAGGKAAAIMTKKIAGLAPAAQRASARQAAHALKMTP